MENSRWSHLPNNVLADGQPASGIRQADGTIACQKCTRTFDDNRNDNERASGRKASCPFCWVAVVVEGEEGNNGQAKSAVWTPGLFGYAQPQGDGSYRFMSGRVGGRLYFLPDDMLTPDRTVFVDGRGKLIEEDLVLPHGRPAKNN